MKLPLIAILLLVGATSSAAPPSTCAQTDPYSQALCAYQRRLFADAEARLTAIVEQGEVSPQTLKAMYFLARTFMKTGRFREAASVFVRIYETDRPFYDAWNCDFLLGECRRAMGKG